MKMKTEEVYCLGKHERKLEILEKKEIKTFLKGERIKQTFDVLTPE